MNPDGRPGVAVLLGDGTARVRMAGGSSRPILAARWVRRDEG